MTGATAQRFSLRDRGLIKPGCFADLTLFDEAELKAAQPDQRRSFGIRGVWINGRQVLKDGELQEELLSDSGRALRV